jgi:hypothetical protein
MRIIGFFLYKVFIQKLWINKNSQEQKGGSQTWNLYRFLFSYKRI